MAPIEGGTLGRTNTTFITYGKIVECHCGCASEITRQNLLEKAASELHGDIQNAIAEFKEDKAQNEVILSHPTGFCHNITRLKLTDDSLCLEFQYNSRTDTKLVYIGGLDEPNLAAMVATSFYFLPPDLLKVNSLTILITDQKTELPRDKFDAVKFTLTSNWDEEEGEDLTLRTDQNSVKIAIQISKLALGDKNPVFMIIDPAGNYKKYLPQRLDINKAREVAVLTDSLRSIELNDTFKK